MRFFFRKNMANKSQVANNPLRAILACWYKYFQIKWVQVMNRCFAKLSPRHVKACFIVFVLLSSIWSTLQIVKNLSAEPAKTFVVHHTTKPKNITESAEVKSNSKNISEKEYQKLGRFRTYMDSLSASATGKATYDSIIRLHPGLLDSLRAVEQYYKSQFKNETKWKNR